MRPTHNVRILVVDDSVVIRRLVSKILSDEPDFEVVGTASNGRLALERIQQLSPDIVIMDVEMPELDGLATLAQLRPRWPSLPVIMFSALTVRAANATLDALTLGATDYVAKPSGLKAASEARAFVRSQLVGKIRTHTSKIMMRRSAVIRSDARVVAASRVASATRKAALPQERIDVVTIGVSTGGPDALAKLLPQLPADFPVPIVVVQHMPPVFTRLLAERLNRSCPLSVSEAEQGGAVKAGQIWIAKGGKHMEVVGSAAAPRLHLSEGEPENSCRPAADVLFRSVARIWGPHVLSVVLTGMGHDGRQGCEVIDKAGGRSIVQDRSSSVVWGMPGAVAEAGLAERTLPLTEIAAAIRSIVGRRGRRASAANQQRKEARHVS